MKVDRVSVLICTFNRARLLRDTLGALQSMVRPAECAVEIVVVDNNSTDNTSAVIAESARAGPLPVVSLRETSQGKSFALNRGLTHARGDIIALTDDDVLPAPDWLERIVVAFRERDVSFVFGKVLPLWGAVPPPELLTPRAQAIWGPLAICDYGEAPVEYRADKFDQRLPIGANLAFSRLALTAIGGWRTDLGKVNNTLISGEDHEIFLRLRRCGHYAGYYDPDITVAHYVPPARLTRRYFRQWFYWHGKTQALMLEDLFPELSVNRVPTIARVPRFLYRQCLHQLFAYVMALAREDALGRLIQELSVLRYIGLLSERWLRGPSHRRPVSARARGSIPGVGVAHR
jgi:glycosyltransferase involved in cell wall biosynthesis